MNETTKSCTKCGETKPMAEFYLRRASDPSGPRRTTCKACESAAAARRRAEGPSLTSELVRFGMSNPDLLSERNRAIVFTDEPIDPAIIAMVHARRAKEAKRQRRVELRRSKEVRPMRFARLEEDE